MAELTRKAKIYPNFLFFFFGFHLLVNYITLVSNLMWSQIFGQLNNFLLSYIYTIPNLIVTPFIPAIMKRISTHNIAKINIFSQLGTAFLFILIPKIWQGKFTDVKTAEYYAALILLYIGALISSFTFTLSQIAMYTCATQISEQSVQFYITGMAAANVITSGTNLIIDAIIDINHPFERHALYYSVSIIAQIFAFYVLFEIMSIKKSIDKTKLTQNEDKITKTKEKNDTKIKGESTFTRYKKFFKKKKILTILNFILFAQTFLFYPSFMFGMPSKTGFLSIPAWNNLMKFLFGISEVSSRLVNSLKIPFVVKIFKPTRIWIFCVFRYVICSVPLFTFLAYNKVFSEMPNYAIIDILNCIFYSLLAFSLGLLGNNIAIVMYLENDSQSDSEIAGVFLCYSIVIGVFMGQLGAVSVKAILGVQII